MPKPDELIPAVSNLPVVMQADDFNALLFARNDLRNLLAKLKKEHDEVLQEVLKADNALNTWLKDRGV